MASATPAAIGMETDADTSSDLADLSALARPIVAAREQVLPVVPALAPLLPGGSLTRGISVTVTGQAATSLALALVAGASAAGSWVAVVGLKSLNPAAAAGLGVSLDRLIVVPTAESLPTVVAALVDAVDIVLVGTENGFRPTDARRLGARVRERGCVLVQVGHSPRGRGLEGAQLRLVATGSEWEGLGSGHGHLTARRAVVEVTGRRSASRPRRDELWLPGPDGEIDRVDGPTGEAGDPRLVLVAK